MLKQCLTCGSDFEVAPHYENHQRRNGRRAPSFCSLQCHAKSRKRIETKESIFNRVIPEPNSGCWLWMDGATFLRGYGRIGSKGAHVVSYRLFCGPIEDGLIVRHRCDNRLCVNPDHLSLGTHLDNRNDCVSRNRQATGSKIARSILNEAMAAKLKAIFEYPVNIASLSRKTGIPKQALYHLKAGRTWRNVPCEK